MTIKRMIAAAMLFGSVSRQAGWTGELVIVSLNTETSSDPIYFELAPGGGHLSGCKADNWMITPLTEGGACSAPTQRF